MVVDRFGYMYAASVASGVYMGYPSTGLFFGAILGYGAYLNSQSRPDPSLQLLISFILAGWMGLRFLFVGKRRVLCRMVNGRVFYPLFICIVSCAVANRSMIKQYI